MYTNSTIYYKEVEERIKRFFRNIRVEIEY